MSNTGFRIFTKIKRPPQKLVQRFVGLPAANIADVMNRTFCLDSRIRPLNDVPLLGTAFTVKSRPGDNLLVHKAVDLAEPGDILVVDANGDLSNSIIGELLAMWAKMRGVGGFIIDGAVRDVNTLKEIGMPIYAAGITPAGPYKNGPGEINVPVSCGGVVINPGDILVGDADGIVVIRQDDAEDILSKTQAKNLAEQQTMADIINMKWDRTWVDAALEEQGCEYN